MENPKLEERKQRDAKCINIIIFQFQNSKNSTYDTDFKQIFRKFSKSARDYGFLYTY
jgi:hypothetical protein